MTHAKAKISVILLPQAGRQDGAYAPLSTDSEGSCSCPGSIARGEAARPDATANRESETGRWT